MDKIPILYINLKSRTDRNKEIINELNKYNLKGERVEAINEDDGYIGCALSHIKCLDLAIERNYEEVIILEDDFIFLQNPNKLNLNIDYDIFLLEINKQQIKAFKSEFSEEMGTKAWNTFEDYKHYRKHYEYLLNQKKEHEENIYATIKKMKKAS